MISNEPSRLPGFHIFSGELALEKIQVLIRSLPCDEILVILPFYIDTNSSKTRLNDLFSNLGLHPQWIVMQNDEKDFWTQINPILRIISRLKIEEYQFFINLEFSYLPFSIAAYNLGSFINAFLYIISEKTFQILEIPPISIKTIDPISLDIILTLYDMGDISPSLKTTVNKGNWISKSKTPIKALAQASYFVKKLEKEKLVKTIRKGKELSVKLTGTGKWIALMSKEES